MRTNRATHRFKNRHNLVAATLLFAALPAFAKPRAHTVATHATLKHGVAASKAHKSVRPSRLHEPAGIAPERATEIQNALIKQGYLSGEPTGVWDAQTSAAMAKLQGDNGWQTKITPDSRGLIKLGLGPQAPQPDQIVSNKSE